MGIEQHVVDDLPAYAMDILDTQDYRRVAAHLDACPQCQQELQAYQAVVDQLPHAIRIQAPNESLRQRVLDRVSSRSTPRVVPANWLDSFIARLRQPVPAWALLTALALVIALLAGNLVLFSQNQARLAQSNFQVVQLAGTDGAAAANGWIVMSQDGSSGTLIVQNLPDLPEGKQYQLWLIQDGNRRSGGVFSVDPHGYASLWVYSPQPLKQYQQFGITIEPAGGSPGPTGAKVMGGKL